MQPSKVCRLRSRGSIPAVSATSKEPTVQDTNPRQPRPEYPHGPDSAPHGSTDLLVVLDGTGRVLAANQQWKELPRREEAADAARNPLGIDYLALFRSSTTDESVGRALSGIEAVLKGERDYYEQEYLRPTPYIFRWFRMTVRSWRQQDIF